MKPAIGDRVLLWIARLALPRGEREWMLGDLAEEHARLRAERGRWSAARWLLAETARNAGGNLSALRLERNVMRNIGRDLRYALRLVRLSPGFTLTIVLTLALGIGANTAIFSVVDALLFKPLPYPGAERMYAVALANDKPQGMASWPYPKYAAFAREQQEFDATAASSTTRVTIDPGGQPQRVEAEVVTSSYFTLFGLRPALGRFFTDSEERAAAVDAVVVIGDALWRNTFAADVAVIGRAVTIKERAYTIVGVMPADFRGQNGAAQLWLPVMMADHFMYKGAATEAFSWWMRPVGRLKPGMTVAAAAARMPALAERVGRIDASRMKSAMRDGRELFQLRPFRDTKVDPDVTKSFLVLLAAVGFVLLIACANTANLLLGRAVRRQTEFAVRRALGASQRDIARQVLVESVALASASAIAAFAVAAVLLKWLMAVKPMNALGFWSQYARTFDFFAVSLDARVAAFTVVIALAVGILFGVLPARQAARGDLNDTLKQRAAGGSPRVRARAALVLAEIAFSVMLLASAGLMVRSFRNAATANLGFEPRGVVSTTMSLQARKPAAFYRDLLARLGAMPGVAGTALATAAPLGGGSSVGPIEIEGRSKKEASVRAGINVVSPGFFTTLGMKQVAGRTFTDDDRETAPRVAVVSAAFARAAWPGEAAVGKRLRHDFRVAFGDPKAWTTVVGVVDDAVYGTLEDPATPMFYLPVWQPLGTPAAMSMAPDTIVVRTGAAAPTLAAIRQIVHTIDPASPLYDAATMEERAGQVTARYRYASAMMGALAVLALLLAAIGTYGVIAYSVAMRTREIGIRMALGARPADVLGLIVGSGVKLTAAGLAIGLGGALAAARVLTTMLYGVTAHDPLTFIAIAALIAAVAGLATYVPARRAMRVEPTRALRQD